MQPSKTEEYIMKMLLLASVMGCFNIGHRALHMRPSRLHSLTNSQNVAVDQRYSSEHMSTGQLEEDVMLLL